MRKTKLARVCHDEKGYDKMERFALVISYKMVLAKRCLCCLPCSKIARREA